MLPEGSKRAASTSSVRDPGPDAKRLRFAHDPWTDEQHRQQDEIVSGKVKDLLPLDISSYDPSDIVIPLATVLHVVGNVALQNNPPTWFHVPKPYECVKLIEESQELVKLVKKSFFSSSYKDVRLHDLFRPKAAVKSPGQFTFVNEQERAVENSWTCKFSGTAGEALWDHIKLNYSGNDATIYANYTAIVQSSSMGKSRTVDELGKSHLVIPINLRHSSSTGFPPADDKVRDFLAATSDNVYARACAFLDALFVHLTEILTEFGDIEYAEIASRFRTKMTEGQTFHKTNPFRVRFYDNVIQTAGQKYDAHTTNASEAKFSLASACENLIKLLTSPKYEPPQPKAPLIILAFDEAHTLTEIKTDGLTQWSHFGELQHALRALVSFPCFSLFMSTSGKICQFTPPREGDNSSRVVHGQISLIQPFTDLGFDSLARQVFLSEDSDSSLNEDNDLSLNEDNDLSLNEDNDLSLNEDSNLPLSEDSDLEELTSISHMAHLGRPLFGSLYDAGAKDTILALAQKKLLNAELGNIKELTMDQEFACLSRRLPLEFYSTSYAAQADERKQVEGHMRVCLKFEEESESMVTVSASEPLLSEAAYNIKQRLINAPKAMKSVIEVFSIKQGDRGEILAMLLFTIARDQFVQNAKSRIIDVAPFLGEELFVSPDFKQKLDADFPNDEMHFNHYIKLHEQAAIDAESVTAFQPRCRSPVCEQPLCLKNIGLILWQVKNDSNFTSTPQPALFAAMDVYKLRILKDGEAAVPIIKIVFALAAKTPSLSIIRKPPSAEYNSVVYEIWSSGISHENLKPVDPSHGTVWDALLQASYGWKSIYQGVPAEHAYLRKSMNPGAATDISHWQRWAEKQAKVSATIT